MDREKAISHLRSTYPDKDLVEEYIREAEHGEGKGYWDAFETTKDLDTDFSLYKEYEGGI